MHQVANIQKNYWNVVCKYFLKFVFLIFCNSSLYLILYNVSKGLYLNEYRINKHANLNYLLDVSKTIGRNIMERWTKRHNPTLLKYICLFKFFLKVWKRAYVYQEPYSNLIKFDAYYWSFVNENKIPFEKTL